MCDKRRIKTNCGVCAMRFPLAAMFFLITAFIFFCFWAFSSFLLDAVVTAMTPLASDLAEPSYTNLLTLLPWAFGIICVLFLVAGIVVVFFLEATADEPEYYYR